MKNRFRHIGSLLLLSVYCLAMSIANSGPAPLVYGEHQSSKQSVFVKSFSTNLFCPLPESKTSNFNSGPSTYPTTTINKVWGLYSQFNNALKAQLRAYYNRRLDCPVYCRKQDIIFPFHYFW